ncbi:MBL fold metallo-hydrolase [Shewanella sp. GXUN23E]|uniref:MBL fold metallo-hydrolase n=1 Tax=Shewanella sp. GXUN23E TaxID=3422498 RepID=UPI003D7EDCC0
MQVFSFYHDSSGSISYVVTANGQAMITDPVLDGNGIGFLKDFADQLLNRIHQLGVKLKSLLESHVHAGHLSDVAYVRRQLGNVRGGQSEQAVFAR